MEMPVTYALAPVFPRINGVNRFNVPLLRLVYTLMFLVLGRDTWTHILTHRGAWDPTDAVAWCVWTAFATLAGLGIARPLRMLPIMLLEIFYKTLWLILVPGRCGCAARWPARTRRASRLHSSGSCCRSSQCRGDTWS